MYSLSVVQNIYFLPMIYCTKPIFFKGRRGRDRMVIGFITTCTYSISGYHHKRCEIESRAQARCTRYNIIWYSLSV